MTKKMATITGENGEEVTITYDGNGGRLITDSHHDGLWRVSWVGPDLATEEKAAEYIHARWGSGRNLVWADAQ